ncbi:MAG: Crp/Fnr family transcriptional regulator [Bacteroidia bacterium]|nr:Crp/Fnr family transcriptional regulator [Bacteroidia bacterium]
MPVKGLYVVRRGEVKEYDNNTQRKESENRIVRNGEIFGHKDFSADKHKFRAIALKNSKICYLKKDSLYQVCLGNPELSLNLLKFFKEELIKTDKKYKNNLYS